MKVGRNYIILNGVIVLLTSLFLIFLLLYKHNDPRLDDWIVGVGWFFFGLAVISFIWNFKSTHVADEEIVIKRLFRPTIVIKQTDIVEIKEGTFKYRGSSASSTVYSGYYLEFVTQNKSYKTTSLNESTYNELRKSLKNIYRGLAKLDSDYRGDSFNWFYILILLAPSLFFVIQIAKELAK